MKLLFYQIVHKSNNLDELWNILLECNNEFVPPLSSRNSPTQSHLLTNTNNKYPIEYFSQIIKQCFILAYTNQKLIGFMTFIYNYRNIDFNKIIKKEEINNYITTICVSKSFRGRGIATQMYNFIESNLPQNFRSDFISTRTWSTNLHHINILHTKNYDKFCIKKNNRGNDIDTLYYLKKT